ncbi:MAG: hypothetical protein GWO24_27880, partial [Akkermansiaceae bacterium]|nr:hypothetical protein [Akkermansiaceae bacterium]
YGTDGYFIAQYPNGDPNNVSQPLYAEIALVGGRGYEGAGAEAHQSMFDDVTASGPGPVADLVAGDYWLNSGATGTLNEFFTITLSE